VLDVGCGTGNALMVAAARGARVMGIDPSARLVDRARARAAEAGVAATFAVAAAERMPLPSEAFDATLSVFAAIFAPDSDAAVAEMLRVTTPGGLLVLTSWLDEGGLAPTARILRDALPPQPGPPRMWGDRAWIEGLLAARGASEVDLVRHELTVTGASPEAVLADLEANHPAWRHGLRVLGEPAWADVHDASLDALRAANEDSGAFAATSPYLVARARR
jgi:SAM-dependent methyltransferase